MQQINFLRLQQEKIRQKAQRTLYLQLSAFSILIVYALVVIGVFSYYFVLGREKSLLDDKIQTARSGIKQEIGIETKQTYLKNKVSSLTNIMESSRNHQVIVQGILSLLTQGVEIKNFGVSSSEDMVFSGKAISFPALEAFLNNLKKGELVKGLSVKSARIESITLDKDGGYGFSIRLSLSGVNNG
jgi:nitrogen fixation/metabolism regulation signal transduction histidine kinase